MLLLALAAALAFNTLRLKVEPLGKAPPAGPVDTAAIQRLAGALQVQTISSASASPSPESLAAFHAFLAQSFPRVHSSLKLEQVAGGSLLFTWPGNDPAAPALLLTAHQDVVPVEAGSEGKWSAPPFNGTIADG